MREGREMRESLGETCSGRLRERWKGNLLGFEREMNLREKAAELRLR